ncbi:MAG: 50S ribosomal protein L18 [Candidatus Babeliaceae bacterium]
MSLKRNIKKRAERRALRVRSKITKDMPRVSVFKSASHIYAQIINDNEHKTIISCSSLELKTKTTGTKVEKAHQVGIELAQKALEKGIQKATFDRGKFLFHGRVKALAEGLKEGGFQV